jgi:hypothetical protein
VAEAIRDELGYAYRWGHLRLLDGGVCWIHCWNQLPDGTIVDATADQFEERWLGGDRGVAVLTPRHASHPNYRAAPPGHLFRTVLAAGRRRLLARRGTSGGTFGADEQEVASAPDTEHGWTALGVYAVQVHSGWALPDWIGSEAGVRLREAEAAGEVLASREFEFALDAAAHRRRIAGHAEWSSPEWRERASSWWTSPWWASPATPREAHVSRRAAAAVPASGP